MTKKGRKHVVMSIVLGIVFTLSLMFNGNNSSTNNIEAMAATGAGVKYRHMSRLMAGRIMYPMVQKVVQRDKLRD